MEHGETCAIENGRKVAAAAGLGHTDGLGAVSYSKSDPVEGQGIKKNKNASKNKYNSGYQEKTKMNQ